MRGTSSGTLAVGNGIVLIQKSNNQYVKFKHLDRSSKPKGQKRTQKMISEGTTTGLHLKKVQGFKDEYNTINEWQALRINPMTGSWEPVR